MSTKDPALDKQIGGDHYKKLRMQPVEFIVQNEIPFLEACVIKRMCRWRVKGGVQDLLKAKHEIDLILAMHDDGEGLL